MINYLFSSVDKEKGFTKEQAKYLKKDINNNLNICFIASIFSDSERNDIQLKRECNHFFDIDINFNNIYLIDDRVDKIEAKEMVKKSDIIFFLGGTPKLQMESILEYDLADEIRFKKIIIGVSAGAMNQTKRVLYLDDFDDYKLKDYYGLGFLDFSIYPHFDINNKAMINEVKTLNEMEKITLLPNESFVRIKNGKASIIGSYFESNLI